MGSWLSIEDFEEFGLKNNKKNKITSYNRKMENKSPREIYELANSLYYGQYHDVNPTKTIDTRGAAIYYKQAYEKLLKYIQNLEILLNSDGEDDY